MIHMYMAFHYAPPEEYLAHPSGPATALDFPLRCAQLCIKHQQVMETVTWNTLEIGTTSLQMTLTYSTSDIIN